MQQTEFYYLNKIERGDTFSPEALNENARATDGLVALADFTARTEANTRAAETAALDQRVTALEVHKIAAGTYQGSGGTEKNIQVGFTPIAVIVCQQHPNDVESCVVAVTNSFAGSTKIPVLSITEGGFIVHSSSYNIPINAGGICHYIAFG